jgi:uncharacterized protein YkwD
MSILTVARLLLVALLITLASACSAPVGPTALPTQVVDPTLTPTSTTAASQTGTSSTSADATAISVAATSISLAATSIAQAAASVSAARGMTPVPSAAPTTPGATPLPGTGNISAGLSTLPGTTVIEATPTSPPQDRNCTDIAAFIMDVTVPDGTLYQPGETFVKTWRVKNAGTCTWDESYRLSFAGGDQLSGPPGNPIPVTEPGELADVSVTLVAAPRGGQQSGNWKFRNYAGREFGTGVPPSLPLWVTINVAFTTHSNTIQIGLPAGGESSGGSECAVQLNNDYIQQIANLINQTRQQIGLEPLTINNQLASAAQAHSKDMACKNFVGHTGSDGSTWVLRLQSTGYANANSARENIYVGNPAFGGTAQGAFNWWMNSRVHKDNILFKDVSEMGIGYTYLPGSEYGGYYTLVLARP